MPTDGEPVAREREFPGFVALSMRITGRTEGELRATGRVRLYHQATLARVGRPGVERFLAALAAAGGDPDGITDADAREVARGIGSLWREGAWGTGCAP
ncbi:hypothetical protein ACIHFE_25890 [Streptomyces sp. NPDC052396]|uniref:hypothetical protein n=1 Tax=Streptomyces sp. NPDC052396 TaxID=3365689 RepID=UPI0037CF095D